MLYCLRRNELKFAGLAEKKIADFRDFLRGKKATPKAVFLPVSAVIVQFSVRLVRGFIASLRAKNVQNATLFSEAKYS